jgi:hypothetical protein
MDIKCGPAFVRFYSGDNWSRFELGVATRAQAGLARRETALLLGFKSDHALERLSVDNPADRFIAPDGSITYGRLCIQGSRHYALSAEQVYTARLFDQAERRARRLAESEFNSQLSRGSEAAPALEASSATT